MNVMVKVKEMIVITQMVSVKTTQAVLNALVKKGIS